MYMEVQLKSKIRQGKDPTISWGFLSSPRYHRVCSEELSTSEASRGRDRMSAKEIYRPYYRLQAARYGFHFNPWGEPNQEMWTFRLSLKCEAAFRVIWPGFWALYLRLDFSFS